MLILFRWKHCAILISLKSVQFAWLHDGHIFFYFWDPWQFAWKLKAYILSIRGIGYKIGENFTMHVLQRYQDCHIACNICYCAEKIMSAVFNCTNVKSFNCIKNAFWQIYCIVTSKTLFPLTAVNSCSWITSPKYETVKR